MGKPVMISQTKYGAWVWEEEPRDERAIYISIIGVPYPDFHLTHLAGDSAKVKVPDLYPR